MSVQKNRQNPLILFKVTIDNVGVPFFETQCRIGDKNRYKKTLDQVTSTVDYYRQSPLFYLFYVFGTDPPYFIVRPRPVYQRQPMQTVHLPCVAFGDPSPTITWRRVSN